MTMEPVTDPAAILDLIDAYRRSKTLFAALELGIFDGQRPHGVALDRLLEACASLGLLERHGEEFVNSPISDQYLRSSSPASLAGYIRYANSTLYPLWAHLEDAVVRGTPRWRQAFGLRGSGLLTRLARRTGCFRNAFPAERARRDFAAGMHAFGLISSPQVAAAFDLAGFRRMVDLGGSTGHLAMAIKDRYPTMQACIFELPEVLPDVRRHVGDRAQLAGGDFFMSPLPPGDLYALGKVLHNWSDERAIMLLRRVHQALPSGGAVLVVERLLDEDGGGPSPVHLHSLNMLVSTGGRERTFSGYRALLQSAGFRDIEMRHTGVITDAILALK